MHTLPHAIAGYIDATNAGAPTRVAACFTSDATVFDEGHLRRGRDEIEAWARETGTHYQATIEPTGLQEEGGRHTLRATVRGNFPGSPIALNFRFRLQSGSIASLEIAP